MKFSVSKNKTLMQTHKLGTSRRRFTMSEVEDQPHEKDQRLQEKPPLPEFNFKNVSNDIVFGIGQLISNPEYNIVVIPVLLFAESIAVKKIRSHVSYTEIDYTAYMEQIDIINSGELDYANIYGGTGPLVYPAGHVLIYKILSYLTGGTDDIATGQFIFSYLYLLNQALTFISYAQLKFPPYLLVLLVLSKRLHSIYVLRLFNDCFTSTFTILTILALQYSGALKNSHQKVSGILTNIVAPGLLSAAISVKMNALLYLPGFLVVSYFLNNEVLASTLIQIAVIVCVQVIVGWNFLFSGHYVRESYLAGAFNFKRKFLYEWTVNWRFISEETFNSDDFHNFLMILQVGLITLFLFTKWASKKQTGKSIASLITDGFQVFKPTLSPLHIINDSQLAPRYVFAVLASSNMIGILVSRSLHYQFLSWYVYSIPFFLHHTYFNNFLIVTAISLVHEWCWNVYPSTVTSSAVLLGINIFSLASYWFNDSLYVRLPPDSVEEKKEK